MVSARVVMDETQFLNENGKLQRTPARERTAESAEESARVLASIPASQPAVSMEWKIASDLADRDRRKDL